ALLRVKLPSKGAVLAPEKALCDTCPLAEKKPERLAIKEIKRPHEIEHDPEQCFLTEGIICLGPATRSGCGERCILANMPCRGCMGPIGGVEDNGIKILSAIAAALGIEGEEDRDDDETRKLINQVVDPGGTFYRFSLPKSILHRKKMKTGG
ncbi:MAG: oxidoreductase, partial [Planctomycetes bacterium]|nr:oxidoreductase [Planctomycetota bacterium]